MQLNYEHNVIRAIVKRDLARMHNKKEEPNWCCMLILIFEGIANTIGRVCVGFVCDREWPVTWGKDTARNRLYVYSISVTICGACTIFRFLRLPDVGVVGGLAGVGEINERFRTAFAVPGLGDARWSADRWFVTHSIVVYSLNQGGQSGQLTTVSSTKHTY